MPDQTAAKKLLAVLNEICDRDTGARHDMQLMQLCHALREFIQSQTSQREAA